MATPISTNTTIVTTQNGTTDNVVGSTEALPETNTIAGVNVENTAADIIENPSQFVEDQGAMVSDSVPTINANAEGTTVDASDYALDPTGVAVTTTTPSTTTADIEVDRKDAATYDAVTTADQITDMRAATGEVSEESLVDADELTLDTTAIATGVNEDGTVNETGKALNDFASQDISRVIDTSTVAGKILADELGQGNYVDAKATVQGQIEILAREFTGPDGEPRIPTWASALTRNVSRTVAFKGVTGTAAISAISTALVEATLPIAESDAKFFQTVTLENLDNKQEAIINKANVLSKMELANLDTRTAAAVNNAKTFMQTDLANLDNEQQARVINQQAKTQAILEDANQENVRRRFNVQSENEMNQFYDKLDTQLSMFNAEQKNTMNRFNAGEINDTAQFNATLENNREQFYLDFQYQIDASNAKWRQTVTLADAEMRFEAAATDAKNILDISTEQLNQLWDRADSLLDYAWREGENAKDREARIEIAEMELEAARAQASATRSAGRSSALGSIAGAAVGAAIPLL